MNKFGEAYWALRGHAKKRNSPPPPDPVKSAGDVLSSLEEPFQSTLLSMYEGRPQLGSDGASYDIDRDTRIRPEQGMWIHDLCRRTRPKRTLEVGLAYGFSALFFLAAHRANGGGQHVGIDPFQSSQWHGIGLQKPRQVGMEESFRCIEDLSALAVPALRAEGLRFEVIFIDGNHRFDDALVDFTLCDLIIEDGGRIILDDLWLPSIRKVVEFIDHNRSDYLREESPIPNIAVYRKHGPDRRGWSHFADF